MAIFKELNNYEEFVSIIKDGMKMKTFESLCGYPNERGLAYLVKFSGDKKKAMSFLRKVDIDLDDYNPDNSMYRKLTFFLRTGILLGECEEYVVKLNAACFSTLVVDGTFSTHEEDLEKYVPLLSDNDLLSYLRETFSDKERDEIFLAMCQHYDKEPFDVKDEKKILEFRKNEIETLTKNKDKFFEGVKSRVMLNEEILKY